MLNLIDDINEIKRRVKLTKDFDSMLVNGFPKLDNRNKKESTLYISLTPKIAS